MKFNVKGTHARTVFDKVLLEVSSKVHEKHPNLTTKQMSEISLKLIDSYPASSLLAIISEAVEAIIEERLSK